MNLRMKNLLADDTLGAGNFVYKLVESGLGHGISLFLDEELSMGSCGIYKEISVETIVRHADSIAT